MLGFFSQFFPLPIKALFHVIVQKPPMRSSGSLEGGAKVKACEGLGCRGFGLRIPPPKGPNLEGFLGWGDWLWNKRGSSIVIDPRLFYVCRGLQIDPHRFLEWVGNMDITTTLTTTDMQKWSWQMDAPWCLWHETETSNDWLAW